MCDAIVSSSRSTIGDWGWWSSNRRRRRFDFRFFVSTGVRLATIHRPTWLPFDSNRVIRYSRSHFETLWNRSLLCFCRRVRWWWWWCGVGTSLAEQQQKIRLTRAVVREDNWLVDLFGPEWWPSLGPTTESFELEAIRLSKLLISVHFLADNMKCVCISECRVETVATRTTDELPYCCAFEPPPIGDSRHRRLPTVTNIDRAVSSIHTSGLRMWSQTLVEVKRMEFLFRRLNNQHKIKITIRLGG